MRARFRAWIEAALVVPCMLGCGACQLIGYDVGAWGADASGPDSKIGLVNEDAALGRTSSDAGGSDGTDADGSACSSAPNACGGCSGLASAPGEGCGQCGLGRYACDGTDGVVCVGGDKSPVPTMTSEEIDNFEDGDSVAESSSGLDGYWYTFSDGTAGTLDPPNGSRLVPAYEGVSGSARSAHITGSGFTDYGAGLIFRPYVADCAVDFSAERGIGFWIKGKANLMVAVATTETVDHAICGAMTCNDHYMMAFELTSSWTHYTLAWHDLSQQGWGTPVAFNPAHVEYLQFFFGPNQDFFELYLDELGIF